MRLIKWLCGSGVIIGRRVQTGMLAALFLFVGVRPAAAEQEGDLTYLHNAGGTTVTITGYAGLGGPLVIPGELGGHPVVAIADGAFQTLGSLTGTLTIPDSVVSIGDAAFIQCTGLTGLTLGSGVTNIGMQAFQQCSGLTGGVTIPASNMKVGPWAFAYCSALTGVVIGNGTMTIGDNAFLECGGLISLMVGNGVTRIGDNAFRRCSGLTGELTIPDSVVDIGSDAFAYCSNLTGVVVGNGVTNIGSSAFTYCLGATSLTLGSSLIKIGVGAFNCCFGLAGGLTIPDSVVSIGPAAFASCFNLTSLSVGSGVTTLGDGAFFQGSGLTGVYFKGPAPASVGTDVFRSVTCTVHYVDGSGGWLATFADRPTAIWTSEATFDAGGGAASYTAHAYSVGLAYGDLPTATRTGMSFGGWWTGPGGGGTQVTAPTQVPYLTTGHTLYAKWESAGGGYLCGPDSDSAVSSAGAYDGYFFATGAFDADAATAVQGTLSVKISDAQLGKLTAKALLRQGALNFTGRAWTSVEADGTCHAVLMARGGETLELFVRQNRIWGTLTGGTVVGPLALDGARNRFAERADAAAQEELSRFAGYYTVALPVYDASSQGSAQAAPKGVGYLTLTVGKGGSAKIAGVLADGTKVSHSSRLLLFDGCGSEACVPFFVPLYGKTGWAGSLLWLTPNRGKVVTDRDLGWYVRWEKPGTGADGFHELLDACGGYYGTLPSLAAQYLFSAGVGGVPFHHSAGTADWAVSPNGVEVTVTGTRMAMVKGLKPVLQDGSYTYDAANGTQATLNFTARTGLFKGKFNLFYDYDVNGRLQHKTVKVPYAGVLTPVRDALFDGLPAGLGHCLVPDNDPAVAAYRLKRSFPVWLGVAP